MGSEMRDLYKPSLKTDHLQHVANGSFSVRSVSKERLDAGLRSLDHCKSLFIEIIFPLAVFPSLSFLLTHSLDRNKLPSWRYSPRQLLIPIVRWETPYLAVMQDSMRSSALDTYFSIVANLGTHTFFMIFLPMLFWCGYTDLGRGYCQPRSTFYLG